MRTSLVSARDPDGWPALHDTNGVLFDSRFVRIPFHCHLHRLCIDILACSLEEVRQGRSWRLKTGRGQRPQVTMPADC